MSSINELVNYLRLQAPGWNITGAKGCLEILNQVQDMLYLQDTFQTIAFMPDGSLPVLTTNDDDRDYTLNKATTGLSDDIWRCDLVLTRVPFQRDYGLNHEQRVYINTRVFNGIEYYKYYHVSTVDARRDGHPELLFSTNPGATTDKFYLLCYKKPTPITSVKIQSALPEQMHINVFLPAALKLLEGYQNGNIIEAIAFIEDEFKPKAQEILNKGEQGQFSTITRHEE